MKKLVVVVCHYSKFFHRLNYGFTEMLCDADPQGVAQSPLNLYIRHNVLTNVIHDEAY